MGRTGSNRHRVNHKPLAEDWGFPARKDWAAASPGALQPCLSSYLKPSADISASRQLPGWPGQAVAPPISRYDGLRHVPTKRRGVLKEPQGQTLPGAEEATEVEREGQQCWQSSCAQHPRPDCELCAAWKLPGLLLWGPAVAATAGVVQAETLSWLEPGSWLRNGPKLQGKHYMSNALCSLKSKK